MSRRLCLPAVVALTLLTAAPVAQAATVTRTFTERGEAVFVVPQGVTQVHLLAVGERGGDGLSGATSTFGARGGRGARVEADLAVSPGQRLYLQIGVGGGQPAFLHGSGAGGGASDVRLCPAVIPGGGCPGVPGAADSLGTRVLVAGGGGGAGDNYTVGLTETAGGNGGDAGLLGAGASGGQTVGARVGGGGASAVAGGSAGTAPARAPGGPGVLGRGGDGGVEFNKVTGAGGGGGLYGGGGSASSETLLGGPVAGGGGGSSFANGLTPIATATVPSTVTGATSSISTGTAPSVAVAYDDTLAPALAVTGPTAPHVAGARPTIRGTAGTALGDGAEVTIRSLGPAGPGPTFTAPVDQDGGFAATFPVALAAGSWQIAVDQVDDAGNLASEKVSFGVDPLAPVLTLAAPVDGGFAASATPELRGVAGSKAKDEATVRLRVFAGPAATGAPAQTIEAPVGAGGAYRATPAALADGRYTVTAAQRDDGQAETTTPPATFLVDTVAPTIDVPFLDGTEVGVGAVLGLFYRCADAGSGIAACDAARPSGAALPTATPGVVAETITATDRAGNVTTRTVTYTVRGAAPVPTGGAADPCRDTGACAPAVVKSAAALKVTSLTRGKPRRGRVKVTVRGTVGAVARGQRLTVRAIRGKRRVARALTLRGTAWRVTLTLPARAGRWSVTASLPGSATLLPSTASRTLRLR